MDNTMIDPFDGSSVAIPVGHLSSPPSDLLPLPIDPWLASSLLQKVIRRGDSGTAARAALTLFRMRPGGIWRRFIVIAFEDVSVALRRSRGILWKAVGYRNEKADGVMKNILTLESQI
jgi:hypothetical protein